MWPSTGERFPVGCKCRCRGAAVSGGRLIEEAWYRRIDHGQRLAAASKGWGWRRSGGTRRASQRVGALNQVLSKGHHPGPDDAVEPAALKADGMRADGLGLGAV